MIARVKALYLKNDLLGPTSIVFISSILMHFCNLLYWFSMVRFLEPVSYGRLNRIIAFYALITPFLGIIQPVVTKFVSEFFAHGKLEEIKFLFTSFFKKIFVFGSCFAVLIFLFKQHIANYLNLGSLLPVFILAFAVFFSLFPALILGVLQGLQKFLSFSINSVVNTASKLIFAILLVGIFGFGVNAALIAFFLGYLISIFLGYLQVPKNILRQSISHLNLNLSSAYKYFFPVTVGLFCFNALFNMDVVLVSHYFSDLDTGIYSISQMAGKVIFFLPSALSIVMFPKAAFAHARNKNTINILFKNLKLAFVILLLAGTFIFILPGFSIKLLTGKFYPESISLVRLFVMAMGFFTLSFIILQYFLSIHSLRFVWTVAIMTVIEFVLINLFHKDLIQVLLVLLFISFTLFILGLFYIKDSLRIKVKTA